MDTQLSPCVPIQAIIVALLYIGQSRQLNHSSLYNRHGNAKLKGEGQIPGIHFDVGRDIRIIAADRFINVNKHNAVDAGHLHFPTEILD